MGITQLHKTIPSFYRSSLTSRAQENRIHINTNKSLSWQGFWTGTFLSLILAVGAPYVETTMHATFMAWDFSSPEAVFIFLLLIGPLNILYKLCSRSRSIALLVAAMALGLYINYYSSWETLDIHTPGWFITTFLTLSALLNALLTCFIPA